MNVEVGGKYTIYSGDRRANAIKDVNECTAYALGKPNLTLRQAEEVAKQSHITQLAILFGNEEAAELHWHAALESSQTSEPKIEE